MPFQITCASQIPVTMVVLASRRARLLDACVKLVTMETDVNVSESFGTPLISRTMMSVYTAFGSLLTKREDIPNVLTCPFFQY